METRGIGLILIISGIAVAAIGWLLASGWLDWFGRLPGDIRIVSDNTRIHIPFTSMVVVSLVLTLLVNLVGRLR